MDSAARNIVSAGIPKNVKHSERLRNILVAGALGLVVLNCEETSSVSKKPTNAPVPAGASISASVNENPNQKSLINTSEEMRIGGAMVEEKVYFVAWQQTTENEFTGKKSESYFVIEVTKDEAKTMQGTYKEMKSLDSKKSEVENTRLQLTLQQDRVTKRRKTEQLTPKEQEKVRDLERRIEKLFTLIHELNNKRDEVESRWQTALLDHPEGATKPIPGGAKYEGRVLTSAELRRLDPDIKLVEPGKKQPQKQ